MENQTDRILEKAGETITYAQHYWKEQKQLIKSDIAEKTAKVTSNLLSNIILGMGACIIILFLSISGAYALGVYFKSIAIGFLVIAGIYTLLLVAMITFRKAWITRPIVSRIIEDFYD